jgi:hypothetical protein
VITIPDPAITISGIRRILDPRALGALGQRLAVGVLPGLDFSNYVRELRLGADGYRIVLGDDPPEKVSPYIAVLKNGVIHVSVNTALHRTTAQSDALNLSSGTLLVRLLWALLVARQVYEEIHYRGPARVFYYLRWAGPLGIDRGDFFSRYSSLEAAAGVLEAVPADVVFRQVGRGLGLLVKGIMDQVFQTIGVAENPYFDSAGSLWPQKKSFPPQVLEALK